MSGYMVQGQNVKGGGKVNDRSIQELLELDLEDIQFYYMHKKFFDDIEETAIMKAQAKKVALYEGFMKEAPLNLYAVYAGLYMENNKQSSLAQKLYVSLSTLRRQRGELFEFLLKKLEEVEREDT